MRPSISNASSSDVDNNSSIPMQDQLYQQNDLDAEEVDDASEEIENNGGENVEEA